MTNKPFVWLAAPALCMLFVTQIIIIIIYIYIYIYIHIPCSYPLVMCYTYYILHNTHIAVDCMQHYAICVVCTQWCLMHGLLHKIQSYMCARFELTILSNWYYIAHTRDSFTREVLWLAELIFSDKELQHPFCSTWFWYNVFTAIHNSYSTMIPINSLVMTYISKRFPADTKQVIVVVKACCCPVCCQLKIVISICGG